MILEQHNHELRTPLADGWTLEAVAFAGPDSAGDWQTAMAHRDGVFRVVQSRKVPGDLPIEKEWYSGPFNETATQLYLNAVGSMTREARQLDSL